MSTRSLYQVASTPNGPMFDLCLVRRLNYANIELTAGNAGRENVGVYLRDRSIRYLRWLGFIDLEAARHNPHTRPVKLDIRAYHDPHSWDLVQLKNSQTVQGAMVEEGVYTVTVNGLPRIIE